MKTRIHTYSFNLTEPEQAAAWQVLKAQLEASSVYRMHALSAGASDRLRFDDGEMIELETAYLFDNQWNTGPTQHHADGCRVFDWWQEYLPHTRNIRRGHWLEITDEMREIRRNTCKCGYCGKMEPAQKGYVFCPHCLDSEYLKESDLHLTRMLPVESRASRKPLTEAERQHLLPLYVEAQTVAKGSRAVAKRAKQRQRIEDKYRTETENAQTERDGFIWLLDNNVPIDNCIFYSHTGRFCFGWRKPLGDAEYSALVEITVEFPFDYDIKRAE